MAQRSAAAPGVPGAKADDSTTAAAVSSHEVSIPSTSIADLRSQIADQLSIADFKDSTYGGRKTPRSVMIAVMNFAGVTSNEGLRTCAPSGASWLLPTCVTSRASRSSIGILSPSAVARSIVDHGAAT